MSMIEGQMLNAGIIIAYGFVSLIAAFILFKFLDSRAVIKTDGGRFGGAVAGFIGTFGVFFAAHLQLTEDAPNLPTLKLERPESFLGFTDTDEQYGFAIAYPHRFQRRPVNGKIMRARFVDRDHPDNSISVYLETVSTENHDKLLAKAKGSEDKFASNLASSLIFLNRQNFEIVTKPVIKKRRNNSGDVGRLIMYEFLNRGVRYGFLQYFVLKKGTRFIYYVERTEQLSTGRGVRDLENEFEDIIGSVVYR